jgi:hypothetical protein
MDFFRKSPLSFSPAGEQVGRVMRALLIVWAAWQGPVPWWHSHGTLANSAANSQEFLREHLSSHHSAIDPCDDLRFCWHVHFDFPAHGRDSSNQDGNRPVGTMNAELAPSGLHQLARTAAFDVPYTAVDVIDGGVLSVQLSPGSGGQHFFDGFAPELALPLRFGVMRC